MVVRDENWNEQAVNRATTKQKLPDQTCPPKLKAFKEHGSSKLSPSSALVVALQRL